MQTHYVRALLRAVAPVAGRVERGFRAVLRERPYDTGLIRALLAITPAAASRLRTTGAFLEEVAYQGRRLAKMNLPPEEAAELLAEFDRVLAEQVGGRFEPAREQLQLWTRLELNRAYYEVREAEAQAFFGLYHAEAESAGLDELLERLVRVLTRAFGAQSGRLMLTAPAQGPARPRYIERGERESYWSFPVEECALLQLRFGKRYPWLPRELAMLHATGARCAEAIRRARMLDEIRRLEAEARRAEEEERRRIGRELHDETAQSLAWLRLRLELLETGAAGPVRAQLAEARQVTERAVEELRRTIAALSPAVVERLGIEAALRQLAARFGKRHGAEVKMGVQGETKGMSRETQEVVYRVAQESLRNAAKHSACSRVKLLLNSTDEYIRLSVHDNGCGFKEAAGGKSMSFGLAGMRERAALSGGRLVVRSAPGKGATVLLELPRDGTRNVEDKGFAH